MTPEPKILHVSTARSWRGGEQQLAYLIEELNQKGIFQQVLCAEDGEMESRCKRENWPHTSVKKRSSVNPLFARQLRKTCRENRINLVHVHDSQSHTFAVMAAAFFGNPVPIIVSRRVDFPVSPSPLSNWKYNHPKVARIVCVSDKIKEITGESIRDKSKLSTVYSGIDPERYAKVVNTQPLYKEFGLSRDLPIVGNVAALAPHKDYPTFIGAAQELIKSGIEAQFVIVGDGPLRNEIQEMVAHSGIKEYFTLTGFRKDILEVLSNFDLFLITSETEGLGTSILDAFGCGIPVVATNAGGIPEIVIHNQTGLLAKVKDAEGIAAQVEVMLKDQPLQQKLVAGAREHLKTFTKQNTAEQSLKVYKEVLMESRL